MNIEDPNIHTRVRNSTALLAPELSQLWTWATKLPDVQDVTDIVIWLRSSDKEPSLKITVSKTSKDNNNNNNSNNSNSNRECQTSLTCSLEEIPLAETLKAKILNNSNSNSKGLPLSKLTSSHSQARAKANNKDSIHLAWTHSWVVAWPKKSMTELLRNSLEMTPTNMASLPLLRKISTSLRSLSGKNARKAAVQSAKMTTWVVIKSLSSPVNTLIIRIVFQSGWRCTIHAPIADAPLTPMANKLAIEISEKGAPLNYYYKKILIWICLVFEQKPYVLIELNQSFR